MNEEKGKSRCSDGGRILECDYFITGNSNPAFVPLAAQAHVISNKNRRKAIFNWAAKGLFFLRGGGGYTHSGYNKTLSPTISCDGIPCETET